MNYTFAKKAGSVAVVTLFIVTILLAAYVLVAAPRNTHVQYFVVEPGQSTREIAEQLHKKNLIQSEFLFRLFSKGLQLDGKAKSGTYAVDRPETLLTWLFRVHRADYRVTPVKITLVEGLNIFETADVLAKNLPHISAEEFVRLATEYEGYLYPDTYLFLPDVSEVNVLNLLLRTFEEKTKDIFVERGLSEQEVADVINLASIVEEETFNNEDRRIVAGVLLNRLEINMPLQVDVTFQYINGKNSYTLTVADLKEDSPYNTYVNRGLPPTPISSPSLESIMAVLDPVPSEYLYFLSSRSGVMYYAKTFEGHIRNRQLYL